MKTKESDRFHYYDDVIIVVADNTKSYRWIISCTIRCCYFDGVVMIVSYIIILLHHVVVIILSSTNLCTLFLLLCNIYHYCYRKNKNAIIYYTGKMLQYNTIIRVFKYILFMTKKVFNLEKVMTNC